MRLTGGGGDGRFLCVSASSCVDSACNLVYQFWMLETRSLYTVDCSSCYEEVPLYLSLVVQTRDSKVVPMEYIF